MSGKKVASTLLTKEMREYLTSTHFWGPALNWGIPVASYNDFFYKHPRTISRNMTVALLLYSTMFMRFAWVVKPRNLLLFACHAANVGAQLAQGYKYLQYQGSKSKD